MNKKFHARNLIIIIFGILMFLCAGIIGAAGYASQHVCPGISPYADSQVVFYQKICPYLDFVDNYIGDYYAHLSTSFFFTAITILVIDNLYIWRDNEREKESLIFELGSNSSFSTTRAARALRSHKSGLNKKSWLEDGSLRECDLQNSDLSECDLNHADLRGAQLQSAELFESVLHDADLRGADLTIANLEGADLKRADFRGADVTGAEMKGADLRGAKISDEQLGSTGSLEGARMPDDEL